MVVLRMCCHTHTGNEVSGGVGSLVECVCSVSMWVLCINCRMGCGLPVARQHLTENWCP